MIAFLIASGLWERRLVSLLVSFLVLFLYGGTMLGGILPSLDARIHGMAICSEPSPALCWRTSWSTFRAAIPPRPWMNRCRKGHQVGRRTETTEANPKSSMNAVLIKLPHAFEDLSFRHIFLQRLQRLSPAHAAINLVGLRLVLTQIFKTPRSSPPTGSQAAWEPNIHWFPGGAWEPNALQAPPAE